MNFQKNIIFVLAIGLALPGIFHGSVCAQQTDSTSHQDYDNDPSLRQEAEDLFYTLRKIATINSLTHVDPWLRHIGRLLYDNTDCYYDSTDCEVISYIIMDLCLDTDCLKSTLNAMRYFKSSSTKKDDDYVLVSEYAASLFNKMYIIPDGLVYKAVLDWFKVYNTITKSQPVSSLNDVHKHRLKNVFRGNYGLALQKITQPWPDLFHDSNLWNNYEQYQIKKLNSDFMTLDADSITTVVLGRDDPLRQQNLQKSLWSYHASQPSLLLHYGLMPLAHPSQVIKTYFDEGYGRKIFCFTDQQENLTQDCQNKLHSYLQLMAGRYNTTLSTLVPADENVDTYYPHYFLSDATTKKQHHLQPPNLDVMLPDADGDQNQIKLFWQQAAHNLLEPILPEKAFALDLVQYINKTKQVVYSVNDILIEYLDFKHYAQQSFGKSDIYYPSSQELHDQVLSLYDAILMGKVPVSPFLALSFLKPHKDKGCTDPLKQNCPVRLALDPNLQIWPYVMHNHDTSLEQAGYHNIQFRTHQPWFDYLMHELLRRYLVLQQTLQNYDCNFYSGHCQSKHDNSEILLSSRLFLSDYRPIYFTEDIFHLQHLDHKIFGGFKDLLNSHQVYKEDKIQALNLVRTSLQTACMLDYNHYSKIEHYNSRSDKDLDMFWHVHNCVSDFLVVNHQDYELFAYFKKDLLPILQGLILQKRFLVKVPIAVDFWQQMYGEIHCDTFQKCTEISDDIFRAMRIFGNKYELIFHLMQLQDFQYTREDMQSLAALGAMYQDNAKTLLTGVRKNSEKILLKHKIVTNIEDKTYPDPLDRAAANAATETTQPQDAAYEPASLRKLLNYWRSAGSVDPAAQDRQRHYLILKSMEAANLRKSPVLKDISGNSQKLSAWIFMQRFTQVYGHMDYYFWRSVNEKLHLMPQSNHIDQNFFIECQFGILNKFSVFTMHDNKIVSADLWRNRQKYHDTGVECTVSFWNQIKWKKKTSLLYGMQFYAQYDASILNAAKLKQSDYQLLYAQHSQPDIDYLSYSMADYGLNSSYFGLGILKHINQNIGLGLASRWHMTWYDINESNMVFANRAPVMQDVAADYVTKFRHPATRNNIYVLDNTKALAINSIFLIPAVDLRAFMLFKHIIPQGMGHQVSLQSNISTGCSGTLLYGNIDQLTVACLSAVYMQVKYSHNINEQFIFSSFMNVFSYIFHVSNNMAFESDFLHKQNLNLVMFGIDLGNDMIKLSTGIKINHPLSVHRTVGLSLKVEIKI